MKLEELLAKYEITTEELSEKGINVEDYSIEELESKIQEFESDSSEGESENGDGEGSEASEDNSESAQDESDDSEGEGSEDDESQFEDGSEGSEDDEDKGEENSDESNEGDNGEFESLQKEHESLKSDFESLQNEHNNLLEKLKGYERKEHEDKANAVFASKVFSALEEEDVKDLRESVHKFSIEEIEEKLFARLGRKQANFSRKEEENTTKLGIYQTSDNGSDSDYADLFAKHLGDE